MYRSRQERKHLKLIARQHSAHSQGKSSLGVDYEDLSKEEYTKARFKCSCSRCIDGKQHKVEKCKLVDNTAQHDYFDYRDIDSHEEDSYWYWLKVHDNFEEWITDKDDTNGVKTITLSMKTIGEIYE